MSATCDYNKGLPRTEISADMIIIDYNNDPLIANPIIGNAVALSPTGYTVFENPYYETDGITSVKIGGAIMYASNDLSAWEQVASRSQSTISVLAISAPYQYYRYWKIVPYTVGTSTPFCAEVNSTDYASKNLVHLDTAPAIGSTVAVTYQPDCIAKDANHVLNNVSVALTFNEYSPT